MYAHRPTSSSLHHEITFLLYSIECLSPSKQLAQYHRTFHRITSSRSNPYPLNREPEISPLGNSIRPFAIALESLSSPAARKSSPPRALARFPPGNWVIRSRAPIFSPPAARKTQPSREAAKGCGDPRGLSGASAKRRKLRANRCGRGVGFMDFKSETGSAPRR